VNINSKYLKGSSNPSRRKQLIKKIADIYEKGKPYPANLDELMKERDKLEDGGKISLYKKGGKVKAKKKKKKRSPMAGLSAAQKEVYRRGLAAYMSSGNRPKTSQHAWAMARVKSAFGKKEAAKIASKAKKKGKKK
jgi:hypothetical protein